MYIKGYIINKVKILILLFIVFVFSNVFVYYINKINVDERIQLVLDDSRAKLNIHYKTLLVHQSRSADSFYHIIINKKGFKELLNKIAIASENEKKDLRKKLQKLIQQEYKIMKNAGVLQFHFVLPNNISFLRMHKPEKFGDDLSTIRNDIRYVNKNLKNVRALVSGKIGHGFRNVYPIFNDAGKYLGALDISFSSNNFQDQLTNISGIHAHFLINKDIFNSSLVYEDKVQKHYIQSSEHTNYLFSLTKRHNTKVCIIDNKEKLKNFSDEIITNMNKGENFSLYVKNNRFEIEVISFLPIQGFLTNKTIGWLVSYSKNEFISKILRFGQLINIFSFFISALILFFVYQQILAESRIKKEHTLFDDVINSSEDMIFVTNFETISFSNKKFKEYLSIDYVDDIKDVMTLFISMYGYLHKDLLKDNESFNNLILRTPQEDRIVCLIDQTMNPKAFTISIAKSSYNEKDFLVTLTDITKIKERELQISNKAFYDSLTGVYNRNKFDELVAIELKRDKRYNNSLSIAIVDIDHFKIFNDTYGHLIGDEVLIMIADYLNTNVRDTDVFARWGGEEFVILFPQTTKEKAQLVCEKLRVGISCLEHKIAGNVTASFGVTQYKENDVLSTLFKRADDSLYKAKESGRNRVCIQ